MSFFGCQPSIMVNAGNTKILSEMAAVNILHEWIVGRARINKRREPKSCKLQVFFGNVKNSEFYNILDVKVYTLNKIPEAMFPALGLRKACLRGPPLKGELTVIYFHFFIFSNQNWWCSHLVANVSPIQPLSLSNLIFIWII